MEIYQEAVRVNVAVSKNNCPARHFPVCSARHR